MHAVDSALDGLTKTERGVILSGESGVGKTFSARLLHESGTRRGMPFVSIDVTTFFPNGVENELFGSERVAGADNAAFSANHIHQAEGSTLSFTNSTPFRLRHRTGWPESCNEASRFEWTDFARAIDISVSLRLPDKISAFWLKRGN
jgi:hypothetical protein